jgi:hypothetical protein
MELEPDSEQGGASYVDDIFQTIFQMGTQNVPSLIT